MSKKKRIITGTIIFAIIVFSLLGLIIYNNLTNYSNVLKANWDIELPLDSMTPIYSANSESSFHGDGIRYHIFLYKNEDETKIKKRVNWSIEEKETIYSTSYSDSVNNWLNKIKVPKENYPNYANCKYWYNKQNDNSEIVILWDNKENKLYIVESFL